MDVFTCRWMCSQCQSLLHSFLLVLQLLCGHVHLGRKVKEGGRESLESLEWVWGLESRRSEDQTCQVACGCELSNGAIEWYGPTLLQQQLQLDTNKHPLSVHRA
jgi:hypothetical protein